MRNWTRWRYLTKGLKCVIIVGGDDSYILIDKMDVEEFDRRISLVKNATTTLCFGLEEVEGLSKGYGSYYSKIFRLNNTGVETMTRSLSKLLRQVHISFKKNKDMG